MLGSTYTVGKPGSLRVRKQYYDEYMYSYLSLGVLQAEYCKHKHGQVRGFVQF